MSQTPKLDAQATEQVWRLPEPGFLEGVKSKDKAILKMHNMSFQYPGAPKPQITGVSLQVCSAAAWLCFALLRVGCSAAIWLWVTLGRVGPEVCMQRA